MATRIAAITGANKGLGFAIVRNLALRYLNSDLNNGPLLIYLTSRSIPRGERALKDILADPQLRDAKALKKDGGLVDIEFSELDVTDGRSREGFVEHLMKRHERGIDILVNNAGVALEGCDAPTARQTLLSNYHSTLHLTTSLLPHMRPRGRIVNISSMLGKLNKYSSPLTSAFLSASSPFPSTSPSSPIATYATPTTTLMNQFLTSSTQNTSTADGWPTSAYAVSKSGVTSMTMAIGKEMIRRAKEQGKEEEAVLVNACCPGYVSTDMTKGRGRKTPDQGSRTPVMLALEDLNLVGGEFWEHGEVGKWEG